MAFEKICTLDELSEGEMEGFESIDGDEVLVIRTGGTDFKAFQGVCPHQAIDLADGVYENGVLTCSAHLWQFDCTSGKGTNPEDCQIAEYPIKIEGDDVLIDATDITPFKSH